MRNQVQLITYVDRFGGKTLSELEALLDGPLAGVFGGVHLLPFFEKIDGADAGFDPVDHTVVDSRLGDWNSVRALGTKVPLMADVIVNHMSSDSPQFQDYSEKGKSSQYDGLFLTMQSVFPDGATEQDLLSVYRPRPGLPFTSVTLKNSEARLLWTTFTPKQIDIDVCHPQGEAYLQSILERLAASGVTMVRLDAVGYAIKKAGSSCFMLPETFDFIDAFAARARNLGLEVLVEVHSYYRRQIDIARRVDWVYDFALPPLVLHALYFGAAAPLLRWIEERPTNAITVLDTHDGIGIIDIGADKSAENAPGLVPPDELDLLVETIHRNSGGASRAATGAAASNLDLYQVNCTFFDALGLDSGAYLIARAIQFFLPGVPQVYYVGALAGGNDVALLEKTGVGRDINRRYYDRNEVESALEQPVVVELIELIRLRNSHPAFHGGFTARKLDESTLILTWVKEAESIELRADLARCAATITTSDGQTVSYQADGMLKRAEKSRKESNVHIGRQEVA
ncbi:sucrose phosphorylase [Massilia sp.]|uniref:sucrose phosphorylase n=1 Tax=Massilia sp. TaxID=1882437 RepID=UPI00352C7A27